MSAALSWIEKEMGFAVTDLTAVQLVIFWVDCSHLFASFCVSACQPKRGQGSQPAEGNYRVRAKELEIAKCPRGDACIACFCGLQCEFAFQESARRCLSGPK